MQTAQQDPIDYKLLYEEQLARLEQLTAEKNRLDSVLASQRDQVVCLSAEIAQLRKMIFGVKVERFVPSPDATVAELQLALDLTTETVAQCKITSATTVEYVRTKIEVSPAKPKAHPGCMQLPVHLRGELILLKPEQDVSGLRRMGEDITEILDYIPAEL